MLGVKTLEKGRSNYLNGLTLIRRNHELMEDFESFKVSNAYRETNVCDDVLANAACSLKYLVFIVIFLIFCMSMF